MRSESFQRVTEIRVRTVLTTQSLSGRSLGGLDRAAALPGEQHSWRSGASLLEGNGEVLEQASRGVEFCVVIVAALMLLR